MLSKSKNPKKSLMLTNLLDKINSQPSSSAMAQMLLDVTKVSLASSSLIASAASPKSPKPPSQPLSKATSTAPIVPPTSIWKLPAGNKSAISLKSWAENIGTTSLNSLAKKALPVSKP